MASDEIVWQVINQQFCSFKLKLDTKIQTFCRNEHNVTGFCSRQSCPLANSRYATVRPDPETGTLYLYVKAAERAHLPSQWWEKVRLSSNYAKALAQIDSSLIYWPKFLIHKCKQRLTRLTQVAIRARRIVKEEERLGEKIVPRLGSKVRRREEARERKAEGAAKVERAIERELIERLRSGAYGDKPINVEEGVWKKVLRGLERAEKGEDELLEDEEEEEGVGEVEYVSDLDEEDDMEDFEDWLEDESAGSQDDVDGSADDDQEDATGSKRKRPVVPASSRKKAAPRVEIEYETEPPQRELLLN